MRGSSLIPCLSSISSCCVTSVVNNCQIGRYSKHMLESSSSSSCSETSVVNNCQTGRCSKLMIESRPG